MTPDQEKELFRMLRMMRNELADLKELVTPYVPSKDEVLTFEEGREFLKVSTSYLRKAIAEGSIPFSKAGGRIKFSKNALMQWMLQQ